MNFQFVGSVVTVVLLVTYLVWSGVNETMVYYMTPAELIAQVEADPSFHQVGVRVSGRLEQGSWSRDMNELTHRFTVVDLDDESVSISVVYRDVLPDTFNDTGQVMVVIEGRYLENGIFDATVVLAKCGSRYEATPDELMGV